MAKKTKILILTTGTGHESMAQATQAAYPKDYFSVKVINLQEEFRKTNRGKVVNIIYDYFPFVYGLGYKLGKTNLGEKISEQSAIEGFKDKIEQLIDQEKPEILFSTVFMYDFVIKNLPAKTRKSFLYLYLTHEPWANHPILYSQEPDLTFVYDQKAVKIAKRFGVNNKKVVPIGWLIRPQFYQINPDQEKQIRQELSFKKDIFTILICAASGTTSVLKILPALFRLKKPVQVIFVAGKSKTTEQVAKSTAKIINKSIAHLESRVNMKVFGFAKNIDRYMKIADLVVSKAGPQMLFESVAAKKPFFSITHLPGHQDSVLEIIKQKKLGLVEERPKKSIDLLVKVVNNPKKYLERFMLPIENERENNIKAAEKLVKYTKNLLR